MANYAVANPVVRAAYLFGSAAQGLAGPASDVDIAIRVAAGTPAKTCFALRLDLIDAVGECLGRETDIVVLNTASLTMIRQVLRYGILLYARNLEMEADWAVQKQKEYFDFKYYMDKDHKAVKSFFGAV